MLGVETRVMPSAVFTFQDGGRLLGQMDTLQANQPAGDFESEAKVRLYRRIKDSATGERIHKIGVRLLQCYDVREPSQSRTPAVDPQLSTRPP